MKLYSIYAINQDTPQQKEMVERWPHCAQYLPFYLFPKTYEQYTKKEHGNSLNLSGYSLVDTQEDKVSATDLTYEEFDTMADQLLGQNFDGKEIVLSVQQGRYLKRTRYADTVEE